MDNAPMHTPEVAALVEAAKAVVRNSYVGKAGGTVTRSKWANYPAADYHALVAAIAKATKP